MKNLAFIYDFLNDSFSLNFPISRENRNLELITIRYDVGHPVENRQYFPHWSDKGFNGTVVNQTVPFLHEGPL